jgi:hypothetical protein
MFHHESFNRKRMPRATNTLSQRPAEQVFCKLGYANVSVKSWTDWRCGSTNISQNHQELKSEKPLCYCADSIPRH